MTGSKPCKPGCKCGKHAIRHGHTTKTTVSPTYKSWEMMKRRCLYPNAHNYKNYGGRGIEIDPDWLEFENFLADMGERPPGTTLDRIDNNWHYEPGNCRWATKKEQQNNRRPVEEWGCKP